MIWNHQYSKYNQQLRPELGSHQSNIGISQKSCEGQWVFQIIAIGLNLENSLLWGFKEGGVASRLVLNLSPAIVMFPRRPRFNQNKYTNRSEYWTFEKRCNTLPARMAKCKIPNSWVLQVNASRQLNGTAVKGQGPHGGRHNLNGITEKDGRPKGLKTSTTFNVNPNDAHCGWPELLSEASFVRTPAGPSGRARILRNQLAVGIPKKYECGLFEVCYVLVLYCFAYLHYMSHVVTRTSDSTLTCTTHWSVVARSCTASRSSFTWGWTDGPKHESWRCWEDVKVSSRARSYTNMSYEHCNTCKRCFRKDKTQRFEQQNLQSIQPYGIWKKK